MSASPDRWAALMYHELETPGRALAGSGPGYSRYCVTSDAFRRQMDALAGAGLWGTSLGEARARGDARSIAITFDDGCQTDWLEAAPILRDHRFGATFFVIAGFLGRRGYLTPEQLRDLAAAGFELGSHSLTHCMLNALGLREVEHELAESRARIEDFAGVPVRHFSCPHGRWSPEIALAARRAGYETVSTSKVGLNGPRTPATRLRRIDVQRGTTALDLLSLARGAGLWRRVVRNATLDSAKRLLGEGRYGALRDRVIRLTHGR